MEREKGGNNAICFIILLLIIIFILKCYQFLNVEGSEHPLLGALFYMIIILGAFKNKYYY